MTFWKKKKGEIEEIKENDLVKKLKSEIQVLKTDISNLNLDNGRKNEELKTSLRKISILEREIELKNDELQKIKKNIEFTEEKRKNEFVLGAGKYKGNVDIPVGTYDVSILSGFAQLETNKPDDIYFALSDNAQDRKRCNWLEMYKNLEITDKTILKIESGGKVKFLLSKHYDYSLEINEYKKSFESKKEEFEREIDEIKSELKILNDELIDKYYNLSDYEMTSEKCKDELVILKTKEKELRENENDIKIDYKICNKNKERYVRQILRNFNSEFNNIIFDVKVKNIDKCRNQLNKSFETLNKLYFYTGVSISSDLLKNKLEQLSILYTYELQFQREKEIQKSIKEQMLEEARAEREIQEQKKKIEKDLQQHVTEVNRLMKYLQKAQLDVEKEMYMDKIKELEEKIKTLETDKETVLEREANAKAGFVYIISNIGSFGENIFKIGMTRRLEPMDRIYELSSASVPFEFDVHAMIFSSDAPYLENMLHKHFATKAVNKVNPRKEFFKVDIDEIEKVVKENYNETVKFTKIPVATEYRQSLNLQEINE